MDSVFYREKNQLPWIRSKELEIMTEGLEAGQNRTQSGGSGICDEKFHGCRTKSMDSLIDLNTLAYWQNLSDFVPLSITI